MTQTSEILYLKDRLKSYKLFENISSKNLKIIQNNSNDEEVIWVILKDYFNIFT